MSSDPNEREKVLDILINYGLEMEDLAVLADMPEELLTTETLPHLLKQIRQHRNAPEPPSPPSPPSPPPTQCLSHGRDPPLNVPSTHSEPSTQNMLPTAPSAPAPSQGSQDTLRTPPSAKGSTPPSSSPAHVRPTVGSPPKVKGISFTISRPLSQQFPTKVGPGFLSDYRGGEPDEYPYVCSLCSYRAVSRVVSRAAVHPASSLVGL